MLYASQKGGKKSQEVGRGREVNGFHLEEDT